MDRVISALKFPFVLLWLLCLFVRDAVHGNLKREPEPLEERTEVCPECHGKMTVEYGPDSPVVEMGFAPGVYACPMCSGRGRMAVT